MVFVKAILLLHLIVNQLVITIVFQLLLVPCVPQSVLIPGWLGAQRSLQVVLVLTFQTSSATVPVAWSPWGVMTPPVLQVVLVAQAIVVNIRMPPLLVLLVVVLWTTISLLSSISSIVPRFIEFFLVITSVVICSQLSSLLVHWMFKICTILQRHMVSIRPKPAKHQMLLSFHHYTHSTNKTAMEKD